MASENAARVERWFPLILKDAAMKPPDTTILDVLTTLKDPISYLRGIIGSFVKGGFDREKAVVRIGLTGRGIVPNYSIEQDLREIPDEDLVGTRIQGLGIKAFAKRQAYRGSNHGEMREHEDDGMGEQTWGAPMTFAEIQGLLGQVLASRKVH